MNRLKELAEDIERIRASLREKSERLGAIASLKTWRVTNGIVPVEQCPSQHEEWEEARIRFAWPPQESDKTFYRQIRLPAQFMGLDLVNSSVTLELCLLIGSQIYVNGELVYGVDYWADTKLVPLELTDAAEGGETYNVVIHCRKGDGFGYFHDADLRIDAVEEWLFTLDTFSEELGFVLFLLQNGDAAEAELLSTALNTVKTYSDALMNETRWPKLLETIAAVRERLRLFETAAKQYRVYLVGHAHIDMNWLWPWRETEDLIRRDFESVDAIMEEFQDVCFSHSQAATYRAMQDRYPELWSRVKSRIEQGRWDVTASTWVEGDLNMAGYETMIRQFLEGISYCREQLGVSPKICWEPDTFGHPATMPKILSGVGLKYYYFCRAGKGVPLFWWESEDGSRVLAFNDPRHYNGSIRASAIVPGSVEMANAYGLPCNMYVYGVGDHGGGVTKQDIKRGIRLNESRLLPRFLFSGSTAFYKDVEQCGACLPVIRGELNPAFEGCYTSHGNIKRANRETEHALVRAEALSVMADLYRSAAGAAQRPSMAREAEHTLRDPWRTQCFNQFHDIVCGCAIRLTYEDAVPASRSAASSADNLSSMAADRMTDRHASIVGSDSSASLTTVTVFNSLSWTRTDIVTLEIRTYPQIASWKTGDALIDSSGSRTPIQKIPDGSVIFLAERIPAFGFVAYRYSKETDREAANHVKPAHSNGTHLLENDHYRLTVHGGSGAVTSLFDKRLMREMALAPGLNVFEVHDEAPHGMSAWSIGPIAGIHRLIRGAEVIPGEEGPVFRSLTVVHRHRASEIRQEIRIYNTIDRIDFVTKVNWQEIGTANTDAPMLKATFAFGLRSPDAFFDIPFGTLQREANGQEVPVLHWCGLSESHSEKNACGISLLNNGKYGSSVQGSTISLTLIRSSYEPDNLPDTGDHEFTYSLYPHEGDWKAGQSARRAWELNQPVAIQLWEKEGAREMETYAAIRIEELGTGGWEESVGIIATSLKHARNILVPHKDFVLRLFETHGKPSRARIRFSFPVEYAEEIDLLEEKIRRLPVDNQVHLDLGTVKPEAILTLRIKPA